MRGSVTILQRVMPWVVFLFLLGGTAPARGQGRMHTVAALKADVSTVQPGTTFTVGILLRMDPGWHTYWKNPGEAGLPTAVRWTLPEGVSAGDILWPVPEKQIENGEVLTYGYGHEVMLLIPMQVSSSVRQGSSLVLKGEVSWLECEHICVPGSASVALTLPVSAGASSPANDALFKTYLGLLPRSASEAPDIKVAAATRGNNVELRVEPQGGRLLETDSASAPDFFPEILDGVTAGRSRTTASPETATILVPLEIAQAPQNALMLKGIVVYRFAGGAREAVAVEVPLTREFLTGAAAGTSGDTGIFQRSFVTIETDRANQSLFVYLALALVGGLLLNIMPCVLPVVALKIFGLVRMAGDRPAQIRKLGWLFSLGVLASFLVLAMFVIILKTAGQQVGWGFQFQEPLFVVAMGAIVFAFGLSLFGVFEIQLPASAVQGVGNVLAKQDAAGRGYAASFSEGVFATILATPCTAPFLGTALGFAFSQPAGVILLIFATVALGMALPYLVLTARPAWLKYLPKPGEWMVAAKQFMGFLMMATLLWLLYILGKQLGMEAVIWTGAFLLSVGVACWVVGRFATLSATRRSYFVAWTVAILTVAGGYWLFMESALDIRSVIAGTPASASQSGTADEGIQWTPFSVTRLDAALKEGKPVFIDFTAEWCLTCKVNEKSVMADSKVVEKFRSTGIIPIRADWTNRNPDITKLLAKFGRSGVPLYVLFPAGKPDAPVVLPEVITTSMVTDAIDRAVGS